VCEELANDVITPVRAGHNAAAIAFGATATGKSYTMGSGASGLHAVTSRPVIIRFRSLLFTHRSRSAVVARKRGPFNSPSVHKAHRNMFSRLHLEVNK